MFVRFASVVIGAALCWCSVLVPLASYASSPIDDALQVGAGTDFTCIRTTGAAVRCWGSNRDGQLGDGTLDPHLVASAVSGLESGVSLIAAGARHACALMGSGTVRCWGDNSDGQLGNNSTTDSTVPVAVLGGLSNVLWVAAGDAHSCAVTTSGAAYCWGKNDSGQLGNGNTSSQLIPVAVVGLAGVSTMDAGKQHTCARTSGGAMMCWGENSFGQLGDGTSGTNRLVPVPVSGLSNGVLSIALGDEHSCARLSVGKVKCWGRNADGQLGDGSQIQRSVPVDVVGLATSTVSISAGSAHTCAVTSANTLICWGSNRFGQLGDQSYLQRSAPVAVSEIDSGAFAVSAGGRHSCARLADGGVKCWGNNEEGAIGDGHDALRLAPAKVVLSTDFPGLVAGLYTNCASDAWGHVHCWGDNRFGQLGIGNTLQRRWPTTLSGARVGPSVGAYHACALDPAGRVLCWGGNQNGQLGVGSHQSQLAPAIVSSLQGVEIDQLSAGAAHVCALSTAGGVWCWGANGGALGDGTELERTTPVQVTGMSSGVDVIASGYAHTCALMETGAVWCWGDNSVGQLGDGTQTKRLAPVVVVGLGQSAISISAGYTHTCAVLVTGDVSCWGGNDNGQLGDGSLQSRGLPAVVTGLGGAATRVAAGYAHTCATLSSGVVRCWGSNASGQLGDGTLTDRKTPVDVQGINAGATSLAAGGLHSCAAKSDSSIWCWGGNRFGQIGDGFAGYQSIPVTALRDDHLFTSGFE